MNQNAYTDNGLRSQQQSKFGKTRNTHFSRINLITFPMILKLLFCFCFFFTFKGTVRFPVTWKGTGRLRKTAGN